MLYLASTSERRRLLLAAAGFEHAIVEPGPEPIGRGAPLELARTRAESKARGALVSGAPGWVLGVDTVVDCDGHELGKPADRAAAGAMLRRLSGRDHRVHTAICLLSHPGGECRRADSSALVRCRSLADAELAAFLASEQWRGKAGAYGIQDSVCDFMQLLQGDLDTVIGLSISALRQLLRRREDLP